MIFIRLSAELRGPDGGTETLHRIGSASVNAGDRYHLVYVARRLLDLLHPYSKLTLLVIENVSPTDAAAQRDLRAFLGVDVTEYYGGLVLGE